MCSKYIHFTFNESPRADMSDEGSDNEEAKKDSFYSDIFSEDEADFTSSQDHTKSSGSDSPDSDAKAPGQKPSNSEPSTSNSADPGSDSSDSNTKNQKRKKVGTQTSDDLSPPPPPVFEINCNRCKFFFRKRSLKSSRNRFRSRSKKK